MNKNKGFTLVELLAIVVILAVIMVIAAPSMTNQIKRTEEENQSILNQKIENAAHLYAAKYYATKLLSGEEINFTLRQLQEDGIINLKNNCTDELSNQKKIVVKNYGYNYEEIKGNNCYQ